MALVTRGDLFIFKCPFEFRHLPKTRGFRWHPELKLWYTKEKEIALRLSHYADKDTEKLLSHDKFQVLESPPKLIALKERDGLKLMEHQEKEAIPFIMSRPKAYLGLEPGLGKTICAAVAVGNLKLPAVYISPPFLVENVKAEFEKWAPRLKILIYHSKLKDRPMPGVDMIIIPDTLIGRPGIIQLIERHLGRRHGFLIVDEAHRFKNEEAKRTQALFGDKAKRGIVSLFKEGRQLYLSGTPMPNRPIELFPILSNVVPDLIEHMRRYAYARRYCNGHMGPFGWDESGASNLAELKSKIVGTFMLRLKKDILDLPPKVEEVFVVAKGMSPTLAKMNRGLGEKYADVEDLIKNQIAAKAGKKADELHVATYRRQLGVEKAHLTIELVHSIMEDTDDNVIIFAFHKEAIDILMHGLQKYKPLLITGETPMKERPKIVYEFQNNKSRRVFVGNYVAMGVGWTLTKANRVLFTEFSYVPGDNTQAADRAHRIGQHQSVLVQYIVYKNSLDKLIIEMLLRKQRSLNYI